MEIQEEIKSLLEKAEWAPKHSVEKSDILYQALKLAESGNGDLKQLVSIRQDYIECLATQGRHELALPHFALLLAHLDDEDNKVGFFNRISILWCYKWFLMAMVNYTSLSKAQIMATLADMERRFLADDLQNQRAVNDYKRRVFFALGELDEAAKYAQLAKEDDSPRRRFMGMDDCEACVTASEVDHFFFRGQFVEAINHAQPILDGKLKCAEVPKETYPTAVLCYSLLGQATEAEQVFKKSIKLLNKEHQELCNYAFLMCHLVRANKLRLGVDLFQQQINMCLKTLNQASIFHFCQASLFLFEQLRASGKERIKLQIDENERLYSVTGLYLLDELIAFFSSWVNEIATKFDTRNGNQHYQVHLMGLYASIKNLNQENPA